MNRRKYARPWHSTEIVSIWSILFFLFFLTTEKSGPFHQNWEESSSWPATRYNFPFFYLFKVHNLSVEVQLSSSLLSQTLGWALIAEAMSQIRASLTGFILLVQPLLSFLWDVLFFHRPTSTVNWIGIAATLLAFYLGMQSGRKPRTEFPQVPTNR